MLFTQAGQRFREQMYPSGHDDKGLLRLHSTYRHDLKLYSSDEGRVSTRGGSRWTAGAASLPSFLMLSSCPIRFK